MRMRYQIIHAIRTLQAVTDNPSLFPDDLVKICELNRQALLWSIADGPKQRVESMPFYILVRKIRGALKELQIKEPRDVV